MQISETPSPDGVLVYNTNVPEMYSFTITTKAKYELINITDQVNAAVTKAKVKSGIAVVFVSHTTAGLLCNEDEGNLKTDILKVIKALEEHSKFSGGFSHDRWFHELKEGNAPAHIVTALLGNSRCFIVNEGQIQLGTWQSILLLELDGPRKREVWIKIIRDS